MRRPALLDVSSVAQLYSDFESILLQGQPTQNELSSGSGHVITVFDRNFFHLVKLDHPKLRAPDSTGKFFMPEEKDLIQAQTCGLGDYSCDHVRARNLPAVYDTLVKPDEVYEIDKVQAATLVFLKNYRDKPYPVMVVLVGPSDDCPLVLITAFPTSENQARNKWSKGTLVWPDS